MENEELTVNKLRDFLSIYNKMVETCFNHCIETFNSRQLTSVEMSCVENCSSKSLGVNQKLMMAFIDTQPEIMNKRMEELEKQQRIMNASSMPSSGDKKDYKIDISN